MPNFSDYINVPKNYFYSEKNSVHSVLEPHFKNKLEAFLENHSIIQKKENYPFLPKEKLLNFPFIDFEPYKNELFSRQQDLRILGELSFSKISTVLEIGGWNGWLTNWLNAKILEVVTVDIFPDDENGLASKKFYPNNDWLSIQADVNDTEIYKTKFDLIIFNHCLNFYSNPISLLNKYLDLLKSGGLLIILGADITGNSSKKEKIVNAFRNYYISKYGFNINFYESKGFFDNQFYYDVMQLDFKFTSYQFSNLSWIRKKILREKSGVFVFNKLIKEKNNTTINSNFNV